MKCSLLKDATEILRTSEAVITTGRYHQKHKGFFYSLFTSIEIIRSGMTSFIVPFLRFIAYWILGLVIIAAIAYVIPLNQNDLNAWRYASGIFSFALIAFALPSTYVTDALSDNQIEIVVSHVRNNQTLSKDQLTALLETINEFHERSLARVSAFQWIMAALWALATYLFSQYAGVISKLAPSSTVFQQIVNGGMSLLFFAVFSLFMLWAIFGYKRSIDKAFRLSRLAIRQLKLETIES